MCTEQVLNRDRVVCSDLILSQPAATCAERQITCWENRKQRPFKMSPWHLPWLQSEPAGCGMRRSAYYKQRNRQIVKCCLPWSRSKHWAAARVALCILFKAGARLRNDFRGENTQFTRLTISRSRIWEVLLYYPFGCGFENYICCSVCLQSEEGLVSIRMRPDEQGRFGFNVKGGSDLNMPILVSRVAPNTPADTCYPKLSEGDQVNTRNVVVHQTLLQNVISNGRLGCFMVRRYLQDDRIFH